MDDINIINNTSSSIDKGFDINKNQKDIIEKNASFDFEDENDVKSLFSDLSSGHSDKLDATIETPKENKLDEFSIFIQETIKNDLASREIFEQKTKNLAEIFWKN